MMDRYVSRQKFKILLAFSLFLGALCPMLIPSRLLSRDYSESNPQEYLSEPKWFLISLLEPTASWVDLSLVLTPPLSEKNMTTSYLTAHNQLVVVEKQEGQELVACLKLHNPTNLDDILAMARLEWQPTPRGYQLKSYSIQNEGEHSNFCHLMHYDTHGFLIRHELHGNLSGDKYLNRLEKYGKNFTWDEHERLTSIVEDNGLIVEYAYPQNARTCVVQHKHAGSLHQRKITYFDSLSRVVEEIMDDGTCLDPDNLDLVHFRRWKKIFYPANDKSSQDPEYIEEGYLDIESKCPHVLTKTYYQEDEHSGKSSCLILDSNENALMFSESNPLENSNQQLESIENHSHAYLDESKFLEFLKGADTVISTKLNCRNQPIQITYKDNTVCHLRYHLDGHLSQIMHRDGTISLFSIDPFGRILERRDSKNGLTTHLEQMVYNSFFIQSLKQEGFISSYDYDNAGFIKSYTVDNGTGNKIVVYHRDPLGRIISSQTTYQDQTTLSETRFWGIDGKLIQISQFDHVGNPLASSEFIHQDGHLTEQVTTVKGIGQSTTFYDTLQRPIYTKSLNSPYTPADTQKINYSVVKKEDGTPYQLIESIEYDSSLRIDKELDLRTKSIRVIYTNASKEVLYEEITTNDPHSGIYLRNCFAYTNGLISSKMSWEWKCGPYNRLEWIKQVAPNTEGRLTSYLYNEHGQLVEKIKPDGIRLRFDYDDNSQLRQVRSSDSSIDYQLLYDEHNRLISAINRATNQQSSRKWGSSGQLVEEVFQNGLILRHTYHENGHRLSTCLPDQSTLLYHYDDKGNLISIDRLGLNGKLHYTLDATLCQTVQKDNYSFYETSSKDNTGYRKKSLDITDGIGQEHIEYIFDETGQLTQETGTFNTSFSFDSLFNLTTQADQNLQYSPYFEITNNSKGHYKYDANGNLVYFSAQDKAFFLRYDAFNRLSEVECEEYLVHYTYDIWDRRQSKTLISKGSEHASCIQLYFYDDQEELGCTSQQGIIEELKLFNVSSKEPNYLLLGAELKGHPYLLTTDFRNCIRSIIDLTTHEVIENYRYSAFGEELIANAQGHNLNTTHIGNPWRYLGKRMDLESGLIYFGKRYYLPQIGRWTSPDPMCWLDGLNPTAFLRNDPIHFIDPQGLFSWPRPLSTLYRHVDNMFNNIVVKSFKTLVSIESKIEWFREYRNQFEDSAFKIIGKTIFTLSGYNNEVTHSGKTKGPEVSDKVRVTCINGILTAFDDCMRAAELISKTHGGVRVHYTYHATSGFTTDVAIAFLTKMGVVSPRARKLAHKWRKLIDEMGGVDGGGKILHYAHSLGGTDTYLAGSLLNEKERAMIHVVTCGSATFIPPGIFGNVRNYVSVRDGVPLLDPFGYWGASRGALPNVYFIKSDSPIPLIDHLFCNPTYLGVIEELGREFQAQYLDSQRNVLPPTIANAG